MYRSSPLRSTLNTVVVIVVVVVVVVVVVIIVLVLVEENIGYLHVLCMI